MPLCRSLPPPADPGVTINRHRASFPPAGIERYRRALQSQPNPSSQVLKSQQSTTAWRTPNPSRLKVLPSQVYPTKTACFSLRTNGSRDRRACRSVNRSALLGRETQRTLKQSRNVFWDHHKSLAGGLSRLKKRTETGWKGASSQPLARKLLRSAHTSGCVAPVRSPVAGQPCCRRPRI